jgi:hypothetical protein
MTFNSIIPLVFAQWIEIFNKPYGRIVAIGGVAMLLGSYIYSKRKKGD